MAIHTLRKGERVTSKVAGYYMGQPGTIIGESQIQYNLDKRYIIELDIGKRIVLAASRTGRKAVYTLAIPKGDTHEWEDQKVIFFGKEWRVFGAELEGIEDLIPLDWNKKVYVERYE